MEKKELINAACGGKAGEKNSHLFRNQIAHKGQKTSGYENPKCGESLRPAEDPNKKIKTTKTNTNFPSSYVLTLSHTIGGNPIYFSFRT